MILLLYVKFSKQDNLNCNLNFFPGYGVRSDGRTVFINASLCDLNYMPTNKPIVVDIPIPPGFSKDS